MTVRSLMRRDLLTMDGYPPAFPRAEIEARLGRPVAKLDANENPYGPSPRVAGALRGCVTHLYPDADCTELRVSLGEYLRVDPDRIVCSAGGDEMIDLLLRLFLDPGDEVIDCTPSFVMYPAAAQYNHGCYVSVPRLNGVTVDVEAVQRAISPRTKVIFLCNPNNPTGNSMPVSDILCILERDKIVVLDEAYAEFSGETLVSLGREHSNLIVLRTMSKWAALAGVRLGYAVAHETVVDAMRRIVSPFHVGVAAQAAGIASLEDRAWLMGNVRKIIAERERLYSRLAALPFGAVYPSETNFLYWTTGGVSATRLRESLAARGVLVRALRDPVEALRFSVGTPQDSEWLLEALEGAYVELRG